jgi:tetratricopeptide (TPR) repeat protein
LNPRDGYAYMERGDVHIHLGNPKEALNNYRRAIEINHRFIKAYYGMATAHIMLGSTKHALAEITRAIELEQQPDDGQYDLLQREDIKCNPISMSDFEKHLSILIEDYLNNGEDINNAIKLIGMDIDNLSQDNLTAEDFASLITEQLKDSGHLNKMLLDISRSEEVIKYDLWHLLSSYNDKMVDR